MYKLVFGREGGDDVENDESDHSDNNTESAIRGLAWLSEGSHPSCFLLILAG